MCPAQGATVYPRIATHRTHTQPTNLPLAAQHREPLHPGPLGRRGQCRGMLRTPSCTAAPGGSHGPAAQGPCPHARHPDLNQHKTEAQVLSA